MKVENVSQCQRSFQNVRDCSRMIQNALDLSKMFEKSLECSIMFNGVLEFPRNFGTHASEYFWLVVGCKLKANCPLVGPGSIGGVLSVGVFLRDPSPYLCVFRRKPL